MKRKVNISLEAVHVVPVSAVQAGELFFFSVAEWHQRGIFLKICLWWLTTTMSAAVRAHYIECRSALASHTVADVGSYNGCSIQWYPNNLESSLIEHPFAVFKSIKDRNKVNNTFSEWNQPCDSEDVPGRGLRCLSKCASSEFCA